MGRIVAAPMRELVAYWGRLRQARPRPTYAEVDVLDIPRPALAQVLLVEPMWEREPLVFRFRVIGTGITRMTGRDLTGSVMEPSIYGEHGEVVLTPPRLTAQEGRPYLFHNRFAWREAGYLSESVFLPLGGDGRPEMLLCGLIAIEREQANADSAVSVTDYRWRPIEDDEIAGLAGE